MDYRNMDTEALNRMLLDRIGELEQAKVVDHHFRQCHSLKEDNGLSFFVDLIVIFLSDVATTINDMTNTLYQEVVDFNKMYSYYIKLKGSSACFGARRITVACSNLSHAIDNKHKDGYDGCLQGLCLINDEHKSLQDQLSSIIKIEQELVSRAK